jgi:hypothetical protein
MLLLNNVLITNIIRLYLALNQIKQLKKSNDFLS